MAPTKYRLTMKPQMEEIHEQEQQIKKSLSQITHSEQQKQPPKMREAEQTIEMALTGDKPLNRCWSKAVNMGSMDDMSTANVQFQLQYLCKELKFKYVRIWSVFTKPMAICDGKRIGNYNYTAMDGVLDFLVQNHLCPWFDFTARPNANVRAADDLVWYRNDNIEFQSRRAWEALFEDFLHHIVKRYGIDEVKNWYFEIGMDMFHGDCRTYEEPDFSFANVYRFACEKVRQIIPGAFFGLSAAVANAQPEQKVALYQNWIAQGHEPDFISFFLFPYIPHLGAQRTAENAFVRSPDEQAFEKQLVLMKDIMNGIGLGNSRLFISEWNISVSTRSFLNDSCFRGAYMCRKAIAAMESVEMMAVWMGSDWNSNYYDTYGVVNGGGGLLTRDGIRKPAYYALQFLGRLGDQVLSTGENYILTQRHTDSYMLLCYNMNWYSPKYFMQVENLEQPEILCDSFEKEIELSMNLVLNGVNENCTYVVKKRSISSEHGSILNEWERFNFDTKLERADIKYLQEICIPHLEIERIQAVRNKLKLSVSLKSQEFAIYHIFLAD
jgi:beta-xylosidase